MEFTTLAFLVFATVAVISAGAVITVRNPVHAALCLVLTFFTVACTWILVGAEFLGVALILVYVGAVMVLFLFVVMMLDVDTEPMREGFVRYLPLGLLVAVVRRSAISFSRRSPIASSCVLFTMFSPRFSKWYSWIWVSTMESTGQDSSQNPQKIHLNRSMS